MNKKIDVIFRQMSNFIHNETQIKDSNDKLIDFMIEWCKTYEQITGCKLDVKDWRNNNGKA